jgi:hypothetical protein
MIPILIATGWINSVAYVTALLHGLSRQVTGRLGRPPEEKSCKSKEEERRAAEDIAGDVVDRVVRETSVEKHREPAV